MSEFQDLFLAVKRAAPVGIWNQGVKLAREQGVSGQSSDDDEVVLRVKAPGFVVAPTVVLYHQDLEWDCECPNEAEVCEHVVAAAVALKQAKEQGKDLPKSENTGDKIQYRFEKRGCGMGLVRVLVRGKEHKELDIPLHRLAARAREQIEIDHIDLEIDKILGPKPPQLLPLTMLKKIFAKLATAPSGTVFLESKAVETGAIEVLPHAVFKDEQGGIELSLVPNPEVDEIVADGVARSGDLLRVIGQTDVTGKRLENLPLVRRFDATQVVDIVTDVLPQFEGRAIVDIQTDRLPGTTTNLKPRLEMNIKQDGHSLSVLPTVVYGKPIQARIDGEQLVHVKGSVPVRDRNAEAELVRKLRDELHLAPGRRVTFQGNEATAFADKLRKFGHKIGQQAEVLYKSELSPQLVMNEDEFDLFFETVDQGKRKRKVSAEAVIGAWRGGFNQVPIEGGGWAPIPQEWLLQHGHRVADLLSVKEGHSNTKKDIPLIAIPTLAQLADDLGQPPPPSFSKLKPIIDGFEKLPKAKVPKGVKATLRHYQEDGVNWLSFLRDVGLGAILADDMGLGKTLQTICSFSGKALVVCPTSVLHNWASEIERFRPSLSVCVYHGPTRKMDSKADVVITTYAILRIDADDLADIEWKTVVLDEAQAIKNPSSQVAKSAYRLMGDFKVALSGTPVENRLEELWSLMHFANRGLLGSHADFQERYSKPISRGEPGSAERLRSKIRPFVLRRVKKEVVPELPPRTDSVLHVEMEPQERAVYDSIRAATRSDVVKQLQAGGNVLAVLEALLRLRQAACHSALIPGQQAETSSKVRTLIDNLEVAASEGHKALVFSQWTSLLDLIEPHLKDAGISFLRLDGSTKNRGAVVNKFQSEQGPPVLLASLKAGGTGLNLTAADYVFLTDPWWNPAAEDQAADRAHRIGQDRPVTVYRLVSSNTVEERILKLQQSKRSLADAALGDAKRAAALTRDDLLALLD